MRVNEAEWTGLCADLAAGRLTLSALFGDRDAVHMALLEEVPGRLALASLPAPPAPFPPSPATTRPPRGWSGPSATSSV